MRGSCGGSCRRSRRKISSGRRPEGIEAGMSEDSVLTVITLFGNDMLVLSRCFVQIWGAALRGKDNHEIRDIERTKPMTR